MNDPVPIPPSPRPTNKVTAGAFAGGVTAVFVWGIKAFAGIEMSAEAAIGLSVVITFAVQYLVRDAE